jgi:hypothetical protein
MIEGGRKIIPANLAPNQLRLSGPNKTDPRTMRRVLA